MVNVRSRRCLHDSCEKLPTFGVIGSKKAVYCKQHAEDGKVDVCNKRCLHDSCMSWPQWSVLPDGSAFVCARHKSDLRAGPVINFRARCNMVGCQKSSRWGLDGKPPTHCPDHGRLTDGLIRTVGRARSTTPHGISSYGAVRGVSVHVKAECMF
ncbi:unnamed protein product [Laminaria digitata]